MQFRDLERLVQDGESERLELKHKAADPQKIMKEVVAFANCKGGRLILGVDDDLTIRGVKYAQEELFVMEKAISSFCKPVPNYSIEQIPITQKRTVLIFTIEESIHKPVFLIYNQKKQTGRAYFRVADKSVQASKELRKILKIKHKAQDAFFAYGEIEQKLMKQFATEEQVSVQSFATFANITAEQASSTLIQLTVANVLEIIPNDEQDWYIMKEKD